VLAFQKAISIRPQDYTARENLITVLVELKRFDEALESADRLVTLDTNRAASYIARGSVMLAAARCEEATNIFQRALALDAASDAAKYYLGMAWQKCGHPNEAAALLDQPLTLNDIQRLNRFLTLGAAYRDLRQYEKSAATFRQGLMEFPRRVELIEPLGHVEYTFLKDYSNALPHFLLMLQLNPHHPERATYVAAINYISNQFSRLPNSTAR
jgi:tetratricopeptide (TPR) repeat protein